MPLWKLMGNEEEVAAVAPPPPTSTAFTTMGLEVLMLLFRSGAFSLNKLRISQYQQRS